MTFQPVLPLSGYTGWRFLQRTLDAQQTAFVESASISRATDNFRENITQIQSAEDLVNDRRLLEVALGAFGLDDDINNKFFIRKILEDGTLDDNALSTRLSDKRYAEFSRAFGFGDLGSRIDETGFLDNIIDRFEARQFEQAVGDQDDNLRLALNVESAISGIISNNESEDAQWFAIMGNAPLREVFESALGLPSGLGRIDLDQQLDIFKERSESVFGASNVSAFSDSDVQEKLVRLFLVRSELNNNVSFSSGSVALTILRS